MWTIKTEQEDGVFTVHRVYRNEKYVFGSRHRNVIMEYLIIQLNLRDEKTAELKERQHVQD